MDKKAKCEKDGRQADGPLREMKKKNSSAGEVEVSKGKNGEIDGDRERIENRNTVRLRYSSIQKE